MALFPTVFTNNETLPSTTMCKNEHSWWASFEFYPEAVGKSKSAFEGRMYVGQNIWSQESCVVKFRNYAPNNAEDLHRIIEDCEESERLLGKFLSEFGGSSCEIEMLVPLLVKMGTTSVFNGLFRLIKGYERVIRDDDFALLERRIKGRFTTYIDKLGAVSIDCPPILQAFCHFTYHESKGKCLVTNIQGGFEIGVLVLSSPVIHSSSATRGPEDRGEDGIQSFFSHHRCNEICSKFLLPSHSILSAVSLPTVDTMKEPCIDQGISPQIAQKASPPPYSCEDMNKQKLLPEYFCEIPGVQTV